MSYIELTTTPFGYKVLFETTGLKVVALSKDRNGGAVVNDILVAERFNEIVYMLRDEK